MSSAIRKFRPVLSQSHISHILTLARKDNSSQSQELIRVLGMYEYKINNEILNPAYTHTPKPSLEEELGFTNHVNHVNASERAVSDEVLYGLWMQEPESLTVEQLKRVRAYRYENGKMTMDEEKSFEKEVLGLTV